MRILITHNRYQQRGGEDTVVANECAMLSDRGHEVEYLGVDNEAIQGIVGKVTAAGRAFYSIDSANTIASIIERFKPDIIHVHNFHGALSPSVFLVAERMRVPVVLTLHNYRLLCANALLFRDGHPCEDCIEHKSFLPGVYHACYRDSGIGSAIVGGAMAFHSLIGTWQKRVSRYIALTEFAAEKMAGSRIPRDRIRVKPNFVPDTGAGTGGGGFALFVGRIAEEKGIATLIEADQKNLLPMPVRVVGEGPLSSLLQQAASRPRSQLIPLGAMPAAQVQELMRAATVLVVPSLWYEGFPMVCAEAFASGLPILCSQIGGLAEIVEDGVTGRLYPPGDAVALGNAMRFFIDGSEQLASMRRAARRTFEAKFGIERNYALLTGIYRELLPGNRDFQSR